MLFLGPIVAQLVTMSVADRTEGRYVVSYDKHYEGSTRPLAGLDLGWRHLTLTLRYNPSLTVLPLESEPRDLLVFHNAYLVANYLWGRTQLTVSEYQGYGDQNFWELALTDPRVASPMPSTSAPGGNASTGAGPGAPTGMGPSAPTGPSVPSGGASGGTSADSGTQTTNQIRALNRVVRYANATTTVALEHRPSSRITLRGELDYVVAGATRDEDRTTYPLITGPRAIATERYELSRSDALTGTANGQYASASTGASAWVGGAAETWGHKFDGHTSSQLGLGVSGTRSPVGNGFIAYSIYPTFNAGLSNQSTVARGTFGATFLASSAPVIDLVTAAVDPRIMLGGVVGWQLDAFSASVAGSSAVSVASQSDRGSLRAYGGGAGIGYQFNPAFSLDAGVRVAYQNFQRQTVLPLSYSAFLGANFALRQRL